VGGLLVSAKGLGEKMEKDSILSDGGGVQSTFMIFGVWSGFLPVPGKIFHSDMGITERYLKEYRENVSMPMIRDICERYGTVYVESKKDFQASVEKAVITPFWYRNDMGKSSLVTNRSCTSNFKVIPANKEIAYRAWGKMWLGITTDEKERVRPPQKLTNGRMRDNWYPLIELGLTRGNCITLLKDCGVQVPQKSACDICPFSSKKRLIERLANDETLYPRIKHIEACWHKREKDEHKFLTVFLEGLPTQEQAKQMLGAQGENVDNSGNCGVCEFS